MTVALYENNFKIGVRYYEKLKISINELLNKLKIVLFKRHESDDDGSDTTTYLREWNLSDLNMEEKEDNKNNNKKEDENS